MAIVLSFLNMKGGVGKTTSCLEFAAQLGAAGKQVLVVDLDGQGSATQMLCESVGDKTVADLLLGRNKTTIEEVIEDARAAWKNCGVLPSSTELLGIEPELTKKYSREFCLKRALMPAHKIFDVILVDLPPAIGLLTVNALVASDFYLALSDVSPFSMNGIRAVEEFAAGIRGEDLPKEERLNPNLKSAGILLTGYQKAITADVRAFLADFEEEFPKNPLKDFRVPHSVKIITSQRRTEPLSKILPDNPVSQCYKKVTDHLLSKKGILA